MRKIDRYLEEYGSSHKNPTNKLIHWICVPAIVFSIIGLLWSIPSGALQNLVSDEIKPFANFASVIAILVIIYYLSLSISLMFGMILILSLMVFGNYLIDINISQPLWLVSLIIFSTAWIGQFYGHKVEGKKPSFLKDVQFLLIGPAWLLHFIYKKLGIPY